MNNPAVGFKVLVNFGCIENPIGERLVMVLLLEPKYSINSYAINQIRINTILLLAGNIAHFSKVHTNKKEVARKFI